MENKTPDYIWKWMLIMFFALVALAILVTALRTEGMAPEDSDKVIELIRKWELTEKQVVVAEVKHEVLKWPKYTIRVGLQWSRKPIPAITGLTTQERAKEWLETASLGYTLPTWIKLGEKYKVDYALPICIAWADSHLGKALKSTNNIGNVGNNDRWQVVHYDSMDKGIEAIFRVLNNKYLGWNKQLWELSGEGRQRMSMTGCENAPAPKKCYATSKGVWSTNVSNCLSVLHNKDITESYFFRLQ